jgi:hypothetical protein
MKMKIKSADPAKLEPERLFTMTDVKPNSENTTKITPTTRLLFPQNEADT